MMPWVKICVKIFIALWHSTAVSRPYCKDLKPQYMCVLYFTIFEGKQECYWTWNCLIEDQQNLWRVGIVRAEQEELLREIGQQVGLLRQQIDQLHSRHRTELALLEHERLQLQQRLQAEVSTDASHTEITVADISPCRCAFLFHWTMPCIAAPAWCECEQIEHNKELAVKCEVQTWQQKHIGLEASDLRERLLDSRYGLWQITLSHWHCC